MYTHQITHTSQFHIAVLALRHHLLVGLDHLSLQFGHDCANTNLSNKETNTKDKVRKRKRKIVRKAQHDAGRVSRESHFYLQFKRAQHAEQAAVCFVHSVNDEMCSTDLDNLREKCNAQ